MDLQQLIAKVEQQTLSQEPLARVAAARHVCDRLSLLGDELVDHFVLLARRDGCSWAQIGSALGVSRQGAQQRYGGALRRLPFIARGRQTSPVARFGPDARRAVVEAQTAARTMGHDHVDTAHLLLGVVIAGPDGAGAKVLAACEVDRATIEEEIVEAAGRGTEATTGRIPFAPGAKKALELSLREALALRSRRIGTEHLLLALLRERKGVAARLLAQHGIDRGRVRATLDALAHDEPPAD